MKQQNMCPMYHFDRAKPHSTWQLSSPSNFKFESWPKMYF